jgi:hypothetical protein
MAKQDMGKPMGNRECNWIHARLPLWVENAEVQGRPEAHGERGDLSLRERRLIERHLATCAKCGQYRASLDQALGALAAVATQLPVLSEAPSLWPTLERRIAGRSVKAMSRWRKAARALGNPSVRPSGDLDGVRPLRPAWTQDTIREALAGGNREQPGSKRLAELFVKLSVAAAVVVAVVGLSVMRQQWKIAQSTIAANSVPLAEPVVLSTVVDEPPQVITQQDQGDTPVNQLAEAEPPRLAEPSSPAVDAAAAPKSPPNTRFGFDLEHGTPMPPDSREPKPVY